MLRKGRLRLPGADFALFKSTFPGIQVLLLSEHENVDLKPSRDVRGLVVVDMFL